jgi:ATP synthase protein I
VTNSKPDANHESDSDSDSGPGSNYGSGPDSKSDWLSAEIGAKAALKLKAQRSGTPGVWFGLGMTGLIGWSVVVPTLLGTAFGVWLDSKYPGVHSWTLMGLAVGILVGCLNAWHWVQSEDKAMHGDGSASADSTRGPLP